MERKLDLGNLSITGLTDIKSFSVPVGTLFPELDCKTLNKIRPIDPAIMSGELVHLTVRSWLLNQDGRNILVDTCVGANKDRPSHRDWHRRSGKEWLKALSQEGLRAEDIDVVMCTHLHADHIGWNTHLENNRWVPTFPNAQYLCGRLEFDYWKSVAGKSDKHGAFVDSVLPVVANGKMEFVENGYELASGLVIELSPGHTPGHLSLNAEVGGIFCGDILHSPLQLRFPWLSTGFCLNPAEARVTREDLLLKISETNRFLIPAHFPDPGWTRIRKTKMGYEQIA